MTIQKNVASQYIYFALVNATTGAALTGATVTAKRTIDGGVQGSCTGTVSEPGNGQYQMALSQADTNGNYIGYLFTATNAIPVNFTVCTTAANPTDGVRLGLTALPNAAAGATGGLPLSVDTSGRVDVLKINGTSQTARDIGASVLLSAGTGTGQLDFTLGVVKANTTQLAGQTVTAAAGVTFPSSVASPTNITSATGITVATNNDKTGYGLSAAAVQAIWDAATTALTTVGSIGKRLADFITGDAYVRLGAPAGASVSADIAAVNAKTTNLPASPAAVGSAMTLTSGERDSVADALLDRTNGIETSWTPRQAMRIILSAVGAKLSGAATTTVSIRDVGDTKNRIVATVDANGNRTAITYINT